MELSMHGLKTLQRMHTLHLEPFDTREGKPSRGFTDTTVIGYGSPVTSDTWEAYKNGISKSKAYLILVVHTTNCARMLEALRLPDLNQHQLDAVLCFSYNTLTCRKYPKFDSVMDYLQKCCDTGSTIDPGKLTKLWTAGAKGKEYENRKRELDIFLTGDYGNG